MLSGNGQNSSYSILYSERIIMLINNTLFKIGQAPARFILSFVVLGLLSPALSHAKRDQAEFKQADRIVVVGDIHGDFKKMRQALLLAELIDKRDRWIAGKTRLVQLGDVPDRGPDTLKIIDFLQRLEIKAKRKGGRVHLLIGNHDAMNVYGDLRYVHPGEYKAFETKHSMARLESLYEDEVEWIKENRPEEEWPVFDEEFRTKWFKYRPPGFVEHRVNWLPDGEIGE